MSDLRLTPPQKTQAYVTDQDREFYQNLDAANHKSMMPEDALAHLRLAYFRMNNKNPTASFPTVSFSDPEKDRLNQHMARLFSVLEKLTPGRDYPISDLMGKPVIATGGTK
jgi:hypothetical protein